MCYVPFNKFTEIVIEDIRLTGIEDESSTANTFTTKPRGILVQDTYNNPIFPIRPKPRIDTDKFDLIDVFKRFRELYKTFDTSLLPWHFVIEFVKGRYYVFNTRPINMKYPVRMNDAVRIVEQGSMNLTDLTKKYFDKRPFSISEAIHVAIVGDSTLDVYTKMTYDVIGKFVISPFARYFKLTEGIGQSIFPLNLGKRFNLDYVVRFSRK